jgi:TonB family protein
MVLKNIVWRWLWLIPFFLLPFSLQSQSESTGNRHIIERVAPAYPSMARNMGLSGAVRVEAVVGPDGNVKMIDVKGGHPVLAQAVVTAVRQWKWEPAPRESHELVEVKFARE